MTLTVGRLVLDDPYTVSSRPGGLALSGDESNSDVGTSVGGLTAAAALTLKRRLVGLQGQLIPVIWAGDPSIDGFYRVAEVTADIGSYAGSSVFVTWALGLEFVGYQPGFEATLIGAPVPNVHGITGKSWAATAGGSVENDLGASATGIAWAHGPEGGGTIWGYTFTSQPRWMRYPLAAADWYVGAAKITVDGQVVEGMELPSAAPGTGTHVLSNGIVRVSLAATPYLGFDVDVYTGGAWRAKRFMFGGPVGTVHNPATSVAMISNDPWCAGLRFINADRTHVDVLLRRGARFATFTMRRYASGGTQGLYRSTAEAATALTGGIRATANDGDGNRFVMSSPSAFTADTTAGGLSSTASPFTVNVGYEIAGTAATVGSTAAEVVAQSMWHTDERIKAVRL